MRNTRLRLLLALSLASNLIFFGLQSSSVVTTVHAQTAKTRIVDTLVDGGGHPRRGKVTFILTQKSASGPAGLVPVGSSVSATLNSGGRFDIRVYPSRSYSPQSYYQVWFTDGSSGSQQLIGIYDIPASTAIVTLAAYKVTDTNLAAQYTFASQTDVNALVTTVSNSTLNLLNGVSRTNNALQKYVEADGTFEDSSIVDGASVTIGKSVAVTGNASATGNATVAGTVTAGHFVGDCSACTGLTGATGGVANAGSTTVGADTDSNGSGVVDLQTRATTRLRINNDGVVEMFSPLKTIEFVNVKAVGAKGDSTDGTDGTDDYSAIQTAINSAPARGGRVFFPPGLYRIGTMLSVPENVLLDGVGSHGSMIAWGGTGYGIELGDGAGIYRHHIAIHDMGVLLTATSSKAIHNYNGWGNELRNIYIEGVPGGANSGVVTEQSIYGYYAFVILNHVKFGFKEMGESSNASTTIVYDHCNGGGDSVSGSIGLDLSSASGGLTDSGDSVWIGGNLEHYDTGVKNRGHTLKIYGLRFEAMGTYNVDIGTFSYGNLIDGAINLDLAKYHDASGSGYNSNVVRNSTQVDQSPFPDTLVGPEVRTAFDTSHVIQKLVGFPGQTAPIVEYYNSSGTLLYSVSVNGTIYSQSDRIRIASSFSPTGTADAAGSVGNITWDSGYVYVKTAGGWKRAALATW